MGYLNLFSITKTQNIRSKKLIILIETFTVNWLKIFGIYKYNLDYVVFLV